MEIKYSLVTAREPEITLSDDGGSERGKPFCLPVGVCTIADCGVKDI
jgi:hypothetical protein